MQAADTPVLRRITRNTRLRPLASFLQLFQPLAIPALLLLTLNLYSPSSSSPFNKLPTSYQSSTAWQYIKQAPGWWETALRTSSPLFVLLEGLSTLLCIQQLGRLSVQSIERSRAPDILQLLYLVAAAGVYVISAYFLYEVSWRRGRLR